MNIALDGFNKLLWEFAACVAGCIEWVSLLIALGFEIAHQVSLLVAASKCLAFYARCIESTSRSGRCGAAMARRQPSVVPITLRGILRARKQSRKAWSKFVVRKAPVAGPIVGRLLSYVNRPTCLPRALKLPF